MIRLFSANIVAMSLAARSHVSRIATKRGEHHCKTYSNWKHAQPEPRKELCDIMNVFGDDAADGSKLSKYICRLRPSRLLLLRNRIDDLLIARVYYLSHECLNILADEGLESPCLRFGGWT